MDFTEAWLEREIARLERALQWIRHQLACLRHRHHHPQQYPKTVAGHIQVGE